MRTSILGISMLCLAAACGQPASTFDQVAESLAVPTEEQIRAESERLNAWFDEQFEAELEYSPIRKTFLGRDDDQDKIDDYSIEAMDAALDRGRARLAELQANFDYDLLNPEAQASYDLAVYQAERAEDSALYRSNAYIFHNMGGGHVRLPQILMAFHRVRDEEDMRNYQARIGESARALNQLIDRAEANAAAGTRPPYFAIEQVLGEAKAVISGAPFDDSGDDSDVWDDATTKIARLESEGVLDAETAEEIRMDVRESLLGDWQSAYQRLIAFQEAELEAVSRTAQGVGALPNGEAFYTERLLSQTTTALSADEIHEIGLAEVARIREEMTRLKSEAGFDMPLEEFFVYLRETKDDPRLYYPNTDEGRQGYLTDSAAAIETIEAQLPNYFGILPKADLEVRRVEPFREQAGAPQHYFAPTPDGSRPGIYYAHLLDMGALPKRELETIAYHEGLPGHHMQIAIQRELQGVPTFRTQAGFTAYSEGWGLYSERLAYEMPGTFEDPLSAFGHLGSIMWRSIRLVVDTGIHAKGWSEQEAIDYFLANSAAPEAQATAEVRRYFVIPGQATSYMVGMLKIIELRERAEAELGEAYDIRDFHDTILGGGAMPLAMLEARIDAWIAETKASASAG